MTDLTSISEDSVGNLGSLKTSQTSTTTTVSSTSYHSSHKFSTISTGSYTSSGATFLEQGCIRLTCGGGVNDVLGSKIKRVPIFSKLTNVERSKVAAILKQKKFKDGQTVIEQGDIGDGLYIINFGKAKVQKKDPRTRMESVVCSLKKFDFFGEGAQLANVARGGAVVAHGSLRVWHLSAAAMTKMFKQGANSQLNNHFPRRNAVGAESAQFSKPKTTKTSVAVQVKQTRKDSFMMTKKKDQTKTKDSETRALLLKAFSDIVLFSTMTQTQKESIIKLMEKHSVANKVTVVREGEPGAHFYVIAEGEFEMYRTTPKGDVQLTDTFKSGGSFGVLALMHEITRDFTIKATGKSNILYSIDRLAFRSVVAEVSSNTLKKTIQFLKGVEYLRPLDDQVLIKVAQSIEYEEYSENQGIVDGEEPESLYIIAEGSVTVKTTLDDGRVETSELKQGEFFGEDCLLENKSDSEKWANTTIECTNAVKCLKLDTKTFSLISTEVTDMIREMSNNRKKTLQTKEPEEKPKEPEEKPKEPEEKPKEPEEKPKDPEEKTKRGPNSWPDGLGKENIKWENLEVLGFLGQGSYGHVQLVQDKKTEKTYALKGVMKKEIVECNQIAHIVSEKRVMMELDSPFILKLFATYKDKDCVYFLLECSLGGELFNVLRARTILDENTAKYYVASVILGFMYMHGKNIIYRDLKPENILLDSKGYAKIADFGFAKELSPEDGFRTFTLCGTPDYLAPEVIMGTGHGFGFDWWCVGILIYELLAGWPPFMDNGGEVMRTYENIVQFNLRWPAHLSNDSISIMCEFLKDAPHERLGMTKGGLDDIKKQPWFYGFDWDGLASGKLSPPVNPKVMSRKDLSNFDPPEDGEIYRIPEEYEATEEDYVWEDEF